MAYYKAVIEVLIDVESEAEACDAISEALRPILREYHTGEHETAWIDWRYLRDPVEDSGEGFELAA